MRSPPLTADGSPSTHPHSPSLAFARCRSLSPTLTHPLTHCLLPIPLLLSALSTMHTKGMAVATASSAPAPAPSAAAAAEEEDDEEEKAAREAAAKIQADAEVRAAKRAAAAAAKSPDAHLQPGGQTMHTKGMATPNKAATTATKVPTPETQGQRPARRSRHRFFQKNPEWWKISELSKFYSQQRRDHLNYLLNGSIS